MNAIDLLSAPMLSASGSLDDVERWLRGDLLEIVLLVSGGFLVVRAARWILAMTQHRRLVRDDGDATQRAAGERRNVAVSRAFGWVMTAVVTVAVGIMVGDRLGIPLATLVPTASVLGVAVGFGAQRLVLDVISGFFLLAERQLSIGDLVRVSAPGTTGGVDGTVEEITLRVTRLRTLSGDVVFIPNGEIRQLTNRSLEWARMIVDVPLRPDDDVDRAIEVLRRACDEMTATETWADVFLEGPDVLGVQSFDVGVLQVRVVAKLPWDLQWDAGRELRRRIALGLLEAGIEPVRPVVAPRSMP